MSEPAVLLAIAAGGAFGALARYATMLAVAPLSGRAFWLATLLINVVGSFALGLLYGASQRRGVAPWVTALVGVGTLGAFTTFSTFAVELVRLLQAQRLVEAGAYGLASVLLATLAAWLGVRLFLP